MSVLKLVSNPSNSCRDISLKSTNVKLIVKGGKDCMVRLLRTMKVCKRCHLDETDDRPLDIDTPTAMPLALCIFNRFDS